MRRPKRSRLYEGVETRQTSFVMPPLQTVDIPFKKLIRALKNLLLLALLEFQKFSSSRLRSLVEKLSMFGAPIRQDFIFFS